MRIDPDVLVVVAAGGASKAGPGLASVSGLPGDDARGVNDVCILRIHLGHGQVPSANTLGRSRVRGRLLPAFTAIVGAVNATAMGGDQARVKAARLAGCNGHVDLHDVRRQPLSELPPSVAAVCGLEKASCHAAVLVVILPRS